MISTNQLDEREVYNFYFSSGLYITGYPIVNRLMGCTAVEESSGNKIIPINQSTVTHCVPYGIIEQQAENAGISFSEHAPRISPINR